MEPLGSGTSVAEGSPDLATDRRDSSRRRWLRRAVIGLATLLVIVLVATIGIGYYFSNVLLDVDNTVSYDETVKSVAGDEVVLNASDATKTPAEVGLAWDGGRAILTSAVKVNGDSVVRTVRTVLRGKLTAGLSVDIDTRVYDGDPRSAHDLAFDNVTVTSELGALPAWYVPPTTAKARSTWVIAVHGYAATRTETLRVLPIVAQAGLPALAISYRNDPDAPAAPDGHYHLGDTEWRDVQSAIEHAQAHGAKAVVLYAWSMGGALSMTALRRMPAQDGALVKGIVMDSAHFDWTAILEYQGSQRGLPGFVTWTAERIIEWRASLSLDDLNQVPYAPQLRVPMLIFVDHADKTVPNQPAIDFARARPDLTTLVETDGGGHTGSWNANPEAYAKHVGEYLAQFS